MVKEEIPNVSRITVITELKRKFPSNNPASWGRNSNKVLAEWYCEYILNDKTKRIKII